MEKGLNAKLEVKNDVQKWNNEIPNTWAHAELGFIASDQLATGHFWGIYIVCWFLVLWFFSPALFKVGAWPSYQLRGGIVCKECVPCRATILEGLAERSGSSTHSLVTFFWKKDHLQRHEGKWDKMQHDLSSKINLKSLTDLVDKGNPTVLLLQDFSESPAFVLWISNSVSCAGEDGD